MQLPAEVRLRENVSYILQCYVVSDSKPIFFEWLKDGSSLMTTPEYKIDHHDTWSTLTFKRLTKNDMATYTCRVKNVEGIDTTSTKLICIFSKSLILCWMLHITILDASSNDPPIITKIVATHLSQPQGSELNIMCPISTGSKPITFKWFKDNTEIKHGNHGSIENKPSFSVLMIPALEPKHSGNYSC
ncbi:hypothetical protein BLA29_009238, partial [Euroglyphus maynei]